MFWRMQHVKNICWQILMQKNFNPLSSPLTFQYPNHTLHILMDALQIDIGQWFIPGSRCNLNRFQVEPKSAGRVMSAVLTSPPTAQHPWGSKILQEWCGNSYKTSTYSPSWGWSRSRSKGNPYKRVCGQNWPSGPYHNSTQVYRIVALSPPVC